MRPDYFWHKLAAILNQVKSTSSIRMVMMLLLMVLLVALLLLRIRDAVSVILRLLTWRLVLILMGRRLRHRWQRFRLIIDATVGQCVHRNGRCALRLGLLLLLLHLDVLRVIGDRGRRNNVWRVRTLLVHAA